VQQFEVSLENRRIVHKTVSVEDRVSIVSNVTLHLPTGCCFITMDNKIKLLKETSVWYPIVAQERFGLIPRKIHKKFSETAFPIGEQQNYFHWLLEDLPQLLVARRQELTFTALTTDRLSKFQEDYLDLLNVSHLCLKYDWILNSKVLIVPKKSSNSSGFGARIQEIRVAFSGHLVERRNEISRIYISRSKSRRSLPQESELEEMLKSNGFRIVHLEEMGILEQIRLFNKATLIVAPHGAGLANLVFCQPETQIVEIMSPVLFNDCYMQISRELGLNHMLVEYGNYKSFGEFQKFVLNVIS
jgi:hypothetical protein